MPDPIQIVLIIVIIVLTALLVAVGAQVFLILKETRESLKKVNGILDNASEVSESVAQPLVSFSNSLSSISGISGLFSWLSGRQKKKAKKKDV